MFGCVLRSEHGTRRSAGKAHADAIRRLYGAASVNLKAVTESEKPSLRLPLMGRGAEGWHQVSGLINAGQKIRSLPSATASSRLPAIVVAGLLGCGPVVMITV
jgi:hypothetical protein